MAARTEPKPKELTFADIDKMLYFDADDAPPRDTVTDYRLVAGLLFHRYNDGTKRHIRMGDGAPLLIISSTEVWFAAGRRDFPIDPKAVDFLLQERAIDGTPEWGRTDMNKLRLTEHGMRLVLQRWIGGGGIHDFFEAGGSLEMGSGQAHWPRNS